MQRTIWIPVVAMTTFLALLAPTGTAHAAATISGNVRVSSVDFTATVGTATAFTLPVDVVRDRIDEPAQSITDFAEACPSKKDRVEWKDCAPAFPDGKPEKSWPLVYKRGSTVTLDQVRLRIKKKNADLRNATVTGTADLGGGASLTFTSSAPVDPTGDEYVVDKPTSTGKLPDTVASFTPMTIRWKVTTPKFTFDAGSSTHSIYVVFDDAQFAQYLTFDDLTTAAANGKSTEADVINGIWTNVFSKTGPAALAIHPRVLDPASGAVTASTATLKYWTPWDFANDYIYMNPLLTCTQATTATLLRDLVTRCGSWAGIFVDVLKSHGITSAVDKGVSDAGVPGTFPAFPAPATPGAPRFMLIKEWTFAGPASGAAADANFPFVTEVRVDFVGARAIANSGRFGLVKEFDDAPGLPGQGPVDNPPGWFGYADHAIVVYDSKVYDPSYGTGPFADIGAWATASLSGFAYVTRVDGPPDPATGRFRRTYTVRGHKGIT